MVSSEDLTKSLEVILVQPKDHVIRGFKKKAFKFWKIMQRKITNDQIPGAYRLLKKPKVFRKTKKEKMKMKIQLHILLQIALIERVNTVK